MTGSFYQARNGSVTLLIVAGVLIVVSVVIMVLAYSRSRLPAQNTEVHIDPYELEDYKQVQPF